jgi:hypothetical protein
MATQDNPYPPKEDQPAPGGANDDNPNLPENA